MTGREDATNARRRAAEMQDRWGIGYPQEPQSARSVIVRPIKRKTYPSAAKRVFAARIVRLADDTVEAEGAAVNLIVDEDTLVFICNVGKQVPPQDQADLIADPIDGYLVVAFNG